MVQVAAEKYFGNNGNGHTTWESAWDAVDIDEWQAISSGGEATIKNKHLAAAFSAASDMTNYFMSEGSNATWEGAMQRGGLAVFSAYIGGGVNSMVAKYGGKGVARGLAKNFGFDANKIRSLTKFDIIEDYAKSLAKRLGGTFDKADGDGQIIKYGKYTVRIMYKGGQRKDPYFRISKEGKGSIDASGKFNSDRQDSHIEFIGDPIDQIENIIKTNERG